MKWFPNQRLKSRFKPEEVPALTAEDVEAAVAAIPPYPGGGKGRGITICAGGFTYFTNAWVLIRMLRKLGCELPVQFWHYGEEEFDGRMRRLVAPYGVECVDGKEMAEAAGRRIGQGWPLKPLSILYSPFEEVLALDADNIPIRNPEYLFECDGYRETGAIFWPDVRRMEPGRPIWELMKVPFRNEPEFESGQIVVNKALCWEPLNLAMWMNEAGRAECIYKIIWGDKDTFRFAWHKFGFPFAMTKQPLQMLSVAGGSCCIGVMCQHDLDGERIFQHRNMLKWELFAENPWVPGFLFEGECREFLAELRAQWDGRIGKPPMKLQGRARKWARTLVENVWLLEAKGKAAQGSAPPPGSQDMPQPAALPAAMPSGGLIEPIGVGTGGLAVRQVDPWPKAYQRGFREVRFFAGGNFGRWSDPRMTFWAVEEDAAGASLVFAGNEGADSPNARLRLQTDGSWLGRSLGTPGRMTL